MPFVTISFSILLTLPLMALAAYLLYRRRTKPALFALGCAVLAACFSIHEYRSLQANALDAHMSTYEESAAENADKNFRTAVDLLREVSLDHPDRQKVRRAITALESMPQGSPQEDLRSRYPDAPVLSIYARVLGIVATYNGHMTAQDVRKDQALQDLVQRIPTSYSGLLAEKVLPCRNFLLSMKADADRAAQRDAHNLAAHKNKLASPGIHKGDSEEELTACMGQPDHVNSTAAEDGTLLKQYVFHQDGRYIYAYTKNGYITDIRDDAK